MHYDRHIIKTTHAFELSNFYFPYSHAVDQSQSMKEKVIQRNEQWIRGGRHEDSAGLPCKGRMGKKRSQ